MNAFLVFVFLCVVTNEFYVTCFSDINMILKRLNKPATKTIKSEDGDIIDCVDIYKQPAFDHPALKHHKIQMKPSMKLSRSLESSETNSSKSIMSQTWRKAGNCPHGTIPIRRVTKEDINRTSSFAKFGRPAPYKNYFLDIAHQMTRNLSLLATNIPSPRPKDRSEAFLITVGNNYIGSESNINVWNPNVENSDFSTGQIWMQNGPGDNFDSIEAGWMVNRGIYGDSRTRLFGAWTKDGYKTTGCFNLLCAGFVQNNAQLSLGAAIEPVSTKGGSQHQIKISIFKDPNTGNWWLHCENVILGYWPSSLFSHLSDSATVVKWGGMVYSPNVRKSPHTLTAMGSGDWAYADYAAYHTNIRIKDSSLQLKYPSNVVEYLDEDNCYSTKISKDSEPKFYFGGPGRNLHCL